MEEYFEKYRMLLIELNQNYGKRAERFILLSTLIFLPSHVFLFLIILHANVAGLYDDDKSLITFYGPIALFNIFLMLITNNILLFLANINFFIFVQPLFYLSTLIILFDSLRAYATDKVIKFNIIKFKEPFFVRKSIKGSSIETSQGGH